MHVLGSLWRDYYAPDAYECKNSEYHRLAQNLTVCSAHIKAELSGKGVQEMELFERTKNSMSEIREEEIFAEGFRLGAKMILDVLDECSEAS